MNVTNATVLFRSDTAANFTSANTTLGNATYNAPEAAYEQDTKRVKIGVGNWTTVPYLPNITQVTNLETNVTTLQGNVTTINASLANKSETSHTHNATSALTSGTVPTARLGSGSANSTTFLRGDQTWAVPPGNGTGGLSDPFGYVLDIRDYGAVLGSTNGTTNTAAIQQALDDAAVQSGGWGSAKILFPNTEIQHDTIYDLASPLWMHGNNIMLEGGGKRSTLLRSNGGPAVVVAKHPRRWHVAKTTYADLDNANATVNTTGTVSGETQLINMERYKPDLIQFRSSGSYPPGSGRAEFAPSMSTGQYFALRSRGGVIQARFPYHPFATGDVDQSTLSCASWPEHDKVTFEFIHHNHSTTVYGAIAGCGGLSNPDPWILIGDGTDYVFDLALTDANAVRRTMIRVRFAQVNTTGIHRVCIQFDPTNADLNKRISAFVDRVRVAVTIQNITPYYTGEFYRLNANNPLDNLDNLWTVWNRIAPWKLSDFSVFGETSKIGEYAGELGTNAGGTARSDYSLLCMSVYTKLIYSVNAIGSAQEKVGGGAADDTTVWAMTAGNNSDAKALGWVCNTFDWSPNGNVNLNVNCRGMARQWLPVWGYICPNGNLFDATKNNAIRGLAIRRADNAAASCGILLGPVLDLVELEDLDPANAGYFASIGCMYTYVSYYLRLRSIKANRMIHLVHTTTDAETIDFGYTWRCAVRLASSEFRLRDFSYPGLTAQHEGFLVDVAGAPLGAGIQLEDFTINSEEKHFMPWGPLIAMTRHPDTGGNGITIRNGNVGTFGGAFLRLDDYAGSYDARGTEVNIDNVKGIMAGPVIQVVGSNWSGRVGISPDNYLNEIIAYEPAKSGPDFCDIRTIDTKGYGIPACGGFLHDCHEVRPKKVPEGGVIAWRSWKPDALTTTYYQGSNSPPEWLAAEVSTSNRNPNAMSANILPGIHAACTLPWPDGSNPTTILHSGITEAFSRVALATILANSTAPTRTHLSMKWGFNSAFTPLLTDYTAKFFELPSTTNSGTWASASARSKATSTNITVSGLNVTAWKVYLRRRWFGSINTWFTATAGSSSNPLAAFVFQTNVREPAHWVITDANDPVISSGNLIFRRPVVPGWTTYATNKILDWLVGGTLGLGGPWFFGLSKTPVSSDDGSGITEPSGGSYARVSVAMSGSNWAEWYDSGFFANKTAIEFLAPTGDWGDISHWFISDASSGGNIIASGPLNRAIRVVSGAPKATFYPGAFQVQL